MYGSGDGRACAVCRTLIRVHLRDRIEDAVPSLEVPVLMPRGVRVLTSAGRRGRRDALVSVLERTGHPRPRPGIDGYWTSVRLHTRVTSAERWRRSLRHARSRGEFLGVDPGAFPRDFASFARFHTALASLPRTDLPEPLTLDELDLFLASRG